MSGIKDDMVKRKQILLLIFAIALVLAIVGYVTKRKTEKTTSEDKKSISEDDIGMDDENRERIEIAKKDGSPQVIINNAEGFAGDTIRVPVNIVNNPGVLGMTMILSYDESIVSLVEIEKEEAYEKIIPLEYSGNLESGIILMWSGTTISDNQVFDGRIATLVFKIKEDAKLCRTPIIFIPDETGIYNDDLEQLSINVTPGILTIK